MVRGYLRSRENEHIIEPPEICSRVSIRLVPFSIDVSIVREYLDSEAVREVEREVEESEFE